MDRVIIAYIKTIVAPNVKNMRKYLLNSLGSMVSMVASNTDMNSSALRKLTRQYPALTSNIVWDGVDVAYFSADNILGHQILRISVCANKLAVRVHIRNPRVKYNENEYREKVICARSTAAISSWKIQSTKNYTTTSHNTVDLLPRWSIWIDFAKLIFRDWPNNLSTVLSEEEIVAKSIYKVTSFLMHDFTSNMSGVTN